MKTRGLGSILNARKDSNSGYLTEKGLYLAGERNLAMDKTASTT